MLAQSWNHSVLKCFQIVFFHFPLVVTIQLFSMSFCALIAHFLLSLNNILFFGRTSLSILLKKCILFVSQFWKLQINLLYTFMYKWLCVHTFSAYLGKHQGTWLLDCMVTEFCLENAPVIANTLFQQCRKWLYTWTSPNGQCWNQIDYILCRQRWRSCTQAAKSRAGADCGSDHQLLIAKFRLKLKKVGGTTRPARYHLNQVPYEYAAEDTDWRG